MGFGTCGSILDAHHRGPPPHCLAGSSDLPEYIESVDGNRGLYQFTLPSPLG